jgi:hypothetical protein
MFVCGGFNGHGMVQVFLSANAIAEMVVDGKDITKTDLPRLYRLTPERLNSGQQHYSLTAFEAFQKQNPDRR